MLGLAQAGQVRVDDGGGGAFMAEVDLDLAEVLALFEQMRGVTVPQRMDVRGLLDAAGLEGHAEAALQRGAAHGYGGGGRPLATVAFGREDQRGMPMRFPVFPQALEGAFGQRHVAILIALATADVEEHALGINVADLEAQPFAQAQAAGINEHQADALIRRGHRGEHTADLGGGEHYRQFELGVGPDQFQFVGPDAVEGFFPEEPEGANDLGARLAGDPLVRFEMDAILAELLGGDQFRRPDIMLTELTDTGQIGFLGARTERQERQVIGEGI
jgi:hypothetical protein